jgi:hypothetical protein
MNPIRLTLQANRVFKRFLFERYGAKRATTILLIGQGVSWFVVQPIATARQINEGRIVPDLRPYPFGDSAFGYGPGTALSIVAVLEVAAAIDRSLSFGEFNLPLPGPGNYYWQGQRALAEGAGSGVPEFFGGELPLPRRAPEPRVLFRGTGGRFAIWPPYVAPSPPISAADIISEFPFTTGQPGPATSSFDHPLPRSMVNFPENLTIAERRLLVEHVRTGLIRTGRNARAREDLAAILAYFEMHALELQQLALPVDPVSVRIFQSLTVGPGLTREQQTYRNAVLLLARNEGISLEDAMIRVAAMLDFPAGSNLEQIFGPIAVARPPAVAGVSFAELERARLRRPLHTFPDPLLEALRRYETVPRARFNRDVVAAVLRERVQIFAATIEEATAIAARWAGRGTVRILRVGGGWVVTVLDYSALPLEIADLALTGAEQFGYLSAIARANAEEDATRREIDVEIARARYQRRLGFLQDAFTGLLGADLPNSRMGAGQQPITGAALTEAQILNRAAMDAAAAAAEQAALNRGRAAAAPGSSLPPPSPAEPRDQGATGPRDVALPRPSVFDQAFSLDLYPDTSENEAEAILAAEVRRLELWRQMLPWLSSQEWPILPEPPPVSNPEPGNFFPGENEMSLFKGSVDFNSVQGGWSESVFSTNQNETAATMMQKMIGWLGYRMRMSMGPDWSGSGCTNPILPYWLRVEDELLLRDSLTYTVLPPGQIAQGNQVVTPPSFPNSGPSGFNVGYQNLDLELGTRVKIQSGVPLQYAYPMFHGIPAAGVVNANTVAGTNAVFLRNASFNAVYQTQLWNLLAYMAQTGLGYRNITGAWNAVNNAPGPYSAPDRWFYDTGNQQVQLWWKNVGASPNPPFFPVGMSYPIGLQASATWPNANALCRLQVRRWKGFQLLQGRWSARVLYFDPVTPSADPFPPGYKFGLVIQRQAREPQIATNNVPQVSPIAWSPWFPSSAVPGIGNGSGQGPNPTITVTQQQIQQWNSIQYVQSKKLGRTFGLERGRQRNRPT